jgi:hypothetical protein
MNIDKLAAFYSQTFLNQTTDLEALKDKNEDLYLVYLLSLFAYNAKNEGFSALIHTLDAQYLEDLELSLKMIGADQAVVALSEVIEYCLENHTQYHRFIDAKLADSEFKTALTALDSMMNNADFDKEIDQKMLKDLCKDAKVSV